MAQQRREFHGALGQRVVAGHETRHHGRAELARQGSPERDLHARQRLRRQAGQQLQVAMSRSDQEQLFATAARGDRIHRLRHAPDCSTARGSAAAGRCSAVPDRHGLEKVRQPHQMRVAVVMAHSAAKPKASTGKWCGHRHIATRKASVSVASVKPPRK